MTSDLLHGRGELFNRCGDGAGTRQLGLPEIHGFSTPAPMKGKRGAGSIVDGPICVRDGPSLMPSERREYSIKQFIIFNLDCPRRARDSAWGKDSALAVHHPGEGPREAELQPLHSARK